MIVLPIVSRALALPLGWMGAVADQITSNAGGDLGSGVDATQEPHVGCSPKTEVTDLVGGTG